MVTAPARPETVRTMVTQTLSERRALAVVRMSASALRYRPASDRNGGLRDEIVALAHRHCRYGAGMIHLKLRKRGNPANHKRVERRYAEAPAAGAAPAAEEGAVGRSPAVAPPARPQ